MGCLGEFDPAASRYACANADDCIDGWFCSEQGFCEEGEAPDAGDPDPGPGDAQGDAATDSADAPTDADDAAPADTAFGDDLETDGTDGDDPGAEDPGPGTEDTDEPDPGTDEPDPGTVEPDTGPDTPDEGDDPDTGPEDPCAPTCDDGSPCTIDTCDPTLGCQNVPTPNIECDDGDVCTSGDVCFGPACVGSTWQGCEDFAFWIGDMEYGPDSTGGGLSGSAWFNADADPGSGTVSLGAFLGEETPWIEGIATGEGASWSIWGEGEYGNLLPDGGRLEIRGQALAQVGGVVHVGIGHPPVGVPLASASNLGSDWVEEILWIAEARADTGLGRASLDGGATWSDW